MRDALTQPATRVQIEAFAAKKGISSVKAAEILETARARQIEQRKANPLVYGYEPPIWYVAKALIRNPVWSAYERAFIKKRLGAEWTAELFAEKMRAKLGLKNPVTKLLIMGANRAAKTDFMSKLTVQTLLQGEKKCCSGAQTLKTQKKNQMSRVWKYLPDELKENNIATKKARSVVENISYTDKNGFAGSRVTLENKSQLDFISYEQTTNSLEGVEYDLAWLDEEYGIGHYNLMTTRITSKAGVFVGTFTPLNGYTAPIAAFLNDAIVTRYHVAYLRPKDGGEKLPYLELGLKKEEYEKLNSWRKQGQTGTCDVPESRPEDCFEWLFDDGDGRNSDQVPGGRTFDAVPRVAVCQGGEAAAIWFYGSDNPYGLPAELIATKMADENAEDKIYSSVYGMARAQKGKLIKTFTEENIVEPEDIPTTGVVRFMVCDPAPERNWVMGWYAYHIASDTLYKYRDWPGPYEVPGQGTPGSWVKPSDKNHGNNDGARGEAQESFGFSYLDYKYEIARLERWQDYLDWIKAGNNPMVPPDEETLEDWDTCDGAEEVMAFRLLDSRAASQSKISKSSNNTLLEDLESVISGWQVADGQKLAIGYSRLIDKCKALKYKVSKRCTNTIQCLNMLTGKDGQKGAAKDFVDLDRYAVMSDIWDYTSEVEQGHGTKVNREQRAEQIGNDILPRQHRRVWW